MSFADTLEFLGDYFNISAIKADIQRGYEFMQEPQWKERFVLLKNEDMYNKMMVRMEAVEKEVTKEKNIIKRYSQQPTTKVAGLL